MVYGFEFSQGNISKVNGNVTLEVRGSDFNCTFTSNTDVSSGAIFYDLGKTINRYGFFDQSLGNINYIGTNYIGTNPPTFKYNKNTKKFSDILVCKAFSRNKTLIDIKLKICLVNDKLYFMCPYQKFSKRILENLSCSQADVSFCNFSYCKLTRADFSGANLSNADLSGADLTGANLSGANLTGANLFEANLSGANLSNCNILRAVLNNAKFNNDTNISNMLLWDNILKSSFTQTIPIVFDGEIFSLKNNNMNINLVSGTNLTENIAGRYISVTSTTPVVGDYNIHFSDKKITFMVPHTNNYNNRDFSGMKFANLDFTNCNFNFTKLNNTDLSGANLSGANLTQADLSNANLSGADLTGANLSGANLTGANLFEANLSGANLSNCNIINANLSSAKFNKDTNISNMLLWDNNLNTSFIQATPIVFDGTSFSLKNNITLVSGTNLTQDIVGRYISSTPVVANYKIHFSNTNNKLIFMVPHTNYMNRDFSGMNLAGFNFSEANLSNANLSGADLTGANLSNANLTGTDLTGANLYGANLSNCNIINATLNKAKFNKDTNISNMLLWDNNSKSSFKQEIPIVFDGESFSLKNNINLVAGTNYTENIAGRYIPNTSSTPVEGSYKIHISDNKLTFIIPYSYYFNKNFSHMNLAGLDLTDCFFFNVVLTGCNFINSKIDNMVFNDKTIIQDLILWDERTKSSFSQTNPISYSGTSLNNGDITLSINSNLTTDIVGQYYSIDGTLQPKTYKISYKDKKLTFLIPYTKLNKRIFNDLDLSNVDLTGSDLTDAKLENTKMINSNLSQCIFFQAILKNTDLRGANLTKCNLIKVSLQNPKFSKNTNIADLILCNNNNENPFSFDQTLPVIFSNESGISQPIQTDRQIKINDNYRNASIQTITNIRGYFLDNTGSEREFNYSVYFRDEKVTTNSSTKKNSNYTYGHTSLIFLIPYCNYQDKLLKDFTKANLSNSNLKSCNFQYCNFEDCNFSGSDISYSDFTNANTQNTIFNNTIRTGTIGLSS